MQLDKYSLEASELDTVFVFTSEGPKGAIRKIIVFQDLGANNVYNLAFGDATADNEIDDYAISDNKDTEKVLATVVAALYQFFESHPNAIVYATGSTPERTRLYQMGIKRFWSAATTDFAILGRLGDSYEPLRIKSNYSAFLVRRKKQ